MSNTTSPGTLADVAHILDHCRVVAVVGLSPKPHRDSYAVTRYMQSQGWRIIPINPNATSILGETAYPDLTEAAKHVRIDLVDVFRNSADVPPVVAEAIAVGAAAIWLQSGIVNAGAAEQARSAGMRFVQDKCLMVEHRRHQSL